MKTADETLDPEDWTAMRRLAHRALDEVLDVQMSIRDRPVWRPVPEATEAFLREPAPREGVGAAAVVEDMLRHVVPHVAGHAHPRFWGWVCGTGTPIGMIAEMIATGVNASSGVFNDAPTRLEQQLLGWMRELFGFPARASGIVTSGASMANVIGLAVGRDARPGPGRPVIYASTEVHSSVDKAVRLLGLGTDSLRKVAVDADYRIRVDALAAQIAADRAEGLRPIAVIASAGTVNTGAIDDLAAVADVAAREQLWFHVDGAIGGIGVIAPALRARLGGIERADSLAFDFHKWLYVPYEAGCILVRDGDLLRESFTSSGSYLEAPPRGIAANPDSSNTRGPQLSRGFTALKVWAQIREHGLAKLGRMIEQNIDQVQRFVALVEAEPSLELLAPAPLNIACFRYRSPGLDDGELDAVNLEILMRMHERGIAAPSSTRLGGRFALRIANTNQRSRREDFDLLVRETVRLGREIEGER